MPYMFQIPTLPKPVYQALKELATELGCTQRGVVCAAILAARDVLAAGQVEALRERLQKVREMDV